eukprot:CAMPEP_0182894892 /NCGR_PEP_ID=MMETSP0034_2-20130328/25352_1 /TAXON_ID=156128 /ORGANISM="Nephroselmis pyriformis, Strain CCMP717" /LENGTH=53 /DNA_ID=CAMNT_0025028695 /DNA_START=1 /DNA_END=158 /DNA_ORIENTATION=+
MPLRAFFLGLRLGEAPSLRLRLIEEITPSTWSDRSMAAGDVWATAGLVRVCSP